MIVFWTALVLSGPSAAVAADSGDHDRAAQLKAAYLFNFANFVQWPDAPPHQAVAICFIGKSKVQRALAASAAGKKAGGRALDVRMIEPAQSAEGCSILFIDAQAVQSGDRPPPADPAVPMLTVSDGSEFLRAGGMIELFSDSNRLRFNINVGAARRAGLTISSDLLQLAASVETAGVP